jgi:exosortase
VSLIQTTTASQQPANRVAESKRLMAQAVAQTAWAAWLQIAILAGVLVLLYHTIIARLAAQWLTDSDSSYGFIVPFFSAWIIWSARKRIAAAPVKPSWLGLVVVLCASGTLLLGAIGAENFLSRISLLIFLAGLAIYFRGWRFFRTMLFPWAVLFLAIPLPTIILNQITLPLQFQASRLATGLISLVGVPVLRQGNLIILPSITLEVVEACSGLRSLFSLITMAALYGYFFEPRIWKRALLVAVAVPIAVAANALRIAGSGILGQYWDPSKAQGFLHLFSGWLIFLVSLCLLFAFHRALSGMNRLLKPRSV